MTERVIKVTLDSKGVRTGSDSAGRSLKKLEKNQKSVEKGFRAIKVAAIAFAAVKVGQLALRQADLFNELQNKLRLVTSGTQNLTDITAELFKVSQNTRTGFEGTVDLYSRVARSTVELGLSQRELIGFTESVSKAIQVSGATAVEASAAIIQLGQGLASGELRGQELRSVMEQLPSVAREIAAGLNTNVGGLRALAEQGALTSEVVFGAIQSRTKEIDEQFALLSPTVAQAFTVMENSALSFIGNLDKSTGITKVLAEAVIDMAGGVDDFGKAIGGALDPADELTTTVTNLSIAAITTAAAFEGVFAILGLGKDLLVNFAEGVGGVAAGLAAIARGDFDLAKAIFTDPDAFEKSTADTVDFFETFSAAIDGASDRISTVLLPAFRSVIDGASSVTEGVTDLSLDLGAAAAARELEKLAEKQGKFLDDLRQQEEALNIAADTGRDYAEVLEDLKIVALAAGNAAFEFDALETAAEIRVLNKEMEARIDAEERLQDVQEEKTELLDDLRQENEALMIATEGALDYSDALAELRIRQAAAGDDEFLSAALDLEEANRNLRAQLEESEDSVTDFVKRARENSQDVLSGFLADPMAEGLDELPGKFAAVLRDIAAEALAAEIFKIIGQAFGGAAGGGGGAAGLFSLGASFFGGAADGANLQKGDFGIVGEKGPELFVAPGAGTVVPNQGAGQFAAPQVTVSPQIINVRDVSEIPAAMQSAAGEEAIINVIRNNPDIVRAATA